MKIVVIGASLSGKTTIAQKLQGKTKDRIIEMDEMLTDLNKGVYPKDSDYKHKVLVPKIISKVLKQEDIIFFTNTDYFTLNDLSKAKGKGFKIIQLEVGLNELTKRNRNRVEKEKYEDLSKYFRGMLQYQQIIKKKGLIDKIINSDQQIDKVVEEILSLK